ncbi:MAG: hypothetical protein COU65_04210 [Candidatus Pacebacteria bacterium CG10_big_fil_rev_8_21_14_0_10_42_12]|nr:MAG: hypothetical protein COU65_04210 [Candidatus Pacebacteria bacterium CG10_big_fil_rev_8_21_14_0_10_42_12]
MIWFFSILLLNLSLLFSVRWLASKHKFPTFFLRKSLHLVSSLGAVLAAIVLTQIQFISLCIIFFLIYFILHKKHQNDAIEDKSHASYGSFLFPLGVLALGATLWNSEPLLITGILVLGIPDAITAVFDEKMFYKTKNRVLIRFSTYLILAAVVLIASKTMPSFSVGLLFSFLLAITENFTFKGWDNLTIPIVYLLFSWTLILF